MNDKEIGKTDKGNLHHINEPIDQAIDTRPFLSSYLHLPFVSSLTIPLSRILVGN